MNPRYDDALPLLVQTVHSWPGFADAIDTVAVVRDLKGRLHLVCKPRLGQALSDAADLTAALSRVIGGWFRGPVRFTTDGRAPGGLARGLMQQTKGRWPGAWDVEFTLPVGARFTIARLQDGPATGLRWCGLQRLLAKEEWLADEEAKLPWPANAKAPLIASFYSYKGGVGRSTLVSVLASRLVRDGRHVVVVDLDLEAPGQAAIFGAEPTAGVIDYVLEDGLSDGDPSLDGLVLDVTHDRIGAGTEPRGSLRLVPAGATGWTLLEKLARLDYLGIADDGRSPVDGALRSLLKRLSALDPKPDHILLDSRSGLHDLGGLSLHGLAHVDVLVMRDDMQSRQGMAVALRALCQRTPSDELRVLVVEGMAEVDLSKARAASERIRDDLHAIFSDTVYARLGDVPPPPDEPEAVHNAWPMPVDSFLERIERARNIRPDVLDRPWLNDIVARLHALVGRKEPV